ncbi:MAG: hypothetical protein SO091_02240 [Oscillospiraceae bacterium]|nr:hypothetical protein [Oscillospiraceae bacterium]
MQAAEMQMKTENSVEAASAILRTLRHAVPVLLALLIALLAAAPVLADETDEAITDTETVSAEPTEDLWDDYTAVAAQLEAVARAEGRDMADKMLSTALHSLTGTSVADDAESAISAAAAPEAAEPKAVVVNASVQAGAKWSAKGILPFLAVVLLAFLGLSLAVRPMRRRRVHSARAYRPMRDRTLNDTAFQSRAHSTL